MLFTKHSKPAKVAVGSAFVILALVNSSIAPAQATDEYLDGVYRIDFHAAYQSYSTVRAPAADTSAVYRFSTSCVDGNCVAGGTQVSTSDRGTFNLPKVTLYWAGLAWRLSESIETTCPDGAGTRSQEVMWSLTPQPGSAVLPGSRSVMATTVCGGDAAGYVVQPILATPIS